MWIQYLVLFLTPFYWFTTAFFRRVRLVTIGDFFTERFKSRFLGGAFAVFTLFMAFLGNGAGYMVAAKTMMALTPKPAAKYTVQEKQSVDLFHEYRALQAKADKAELEPVEAARLTELGERQKKGELKAFISYTDSVSIYLIYTVIVAVYTMMGGFLAAAITDVIQGILLTTFSLMLIPIALHRVGGFAGLHAAVPDYMFRLFGSAATSEYAWYTILAMVLANLVSIIAVATGMQTAGSAKNETTARVGMIGGMFFKRFIMIFWALTGLLAIALYSGQLHDPDLIWGHMTMDLLFPGAIGLMMAGVLSAKMSSLAGSSVSYSALFIRNLYQPFVKPKSDRHLLNVGRVAIAVTLARRRGRGPVHRQPARHVQVLHLAAGHLRGGHLAGLPVAARDPDRRHRPGLRLLRHLRPHPQRLPVARVGPDAAGVSARDPGPDGHHQTQAVREDVEAGRAAAVGETIRKDHTSPPEGIFFEKVVRTDPQDPASPKVGIGRFHAEVWVLSWFGVDFSGFSKAQLSAVRFGFDALFPFVLLFLLSAFTRPVPKADLDRFFARVHTPVQPTPELEERALRRAVEHYDEAVEAHKLRPGSNWEIMKPKLVDILGFAAAGLLVGVIIFLLWLIVNIR